MGVRDGRIHIAIADGARSTKAYICCVISHIPRFSRYNSCLSSTGASYVTNPVD